MVDFLSGINVQNVQIFVGVVIAVRNETHGQDLSIRSALVNKLVP